jgi:nucleotide-binding universal stress UspA family protein
VGHIVVGVDGSASSKEALRWAAAEAERRGDVLEVVMAWDNPFRDMWIPATSAGADPLAHLRRALERTVSVVLGEDAQVKVECRVVEGHPAKVLVETARGAELLVVGSRGRGGLAGAILGSVSLHCVAHAPCPVVILRGPVTAT